MVLIDPMAGNIPTEKQADTEYTATTNGIDSKGTRFRQGILKRGAKTEGSGEFGPAEDSIKRSNLIGRTRAVIDVWLDLQRTSSEPNDREFGNFEIVKKAKS